MVTQHPYIVVHFIEAEHHRIDRLILEGFNEVALDGITGINQNDVVRLAADLFYLCGDLAQATTGIRFVTGVIPRHEMSVNVRCT